MSSTAHAALQVVLEQWRGSVIQRQREEIERLRMELEDVRGQVARWIGAPPRDDDSDRSIGEMFESPTESDDEGSIAD